jgi:cell division protein FtsL
MRVIFTTFVIVAVFLTFYGVHYSTQVDIIRGEHRELTSQVAETSKLLKNNRELLQRRQELTPYLAAAAQVQKEIDAMREQLVKLKQEIDKTQSLFASLVKRARTEAPGTAVAEMRLSSGQLLRNAKIMRIENHNITVAHDGGVTNLTADDLPDDLRQRFGYTLDLPRSYLQSEQSTKPKPIPEVVIPAPNSTTTGASERRPAAAPAAPTNRYRDGDPGLWNGVTRQELGRAYIPGQGWLKVGPSGPIPKSTR